MRTRLPQYYVVHTHESATFWQEKGISIIILVQVLAKILQIPKQVIKC